MTALSAIRRWLVPMTLNGSDDVALGYEHGGTAPWRMRRRDSTGERVSDDDERQRRSAEAPRWDVTGIISIGFTSFQAGNSALLVRLRRPRYRIGSQDVAEYFDHPGSVGPRPGGTVRDSIFEGGWTGGSAAADRR